MLRNLNRLVIILLATALGFSSTAEAELQARAGGAFLYDTEADVTWISDWNLAWSTRFSDTAPVPGSVFGNGRMTWEAAHSWAAGLSLAGSSDWRLPSVSIDSSCYFGSPASSRLSSCTSGEFTELWTESLVGDFGDRPGQLENQDRVTLFDNMQTSNYWTEGLNANDPGGASANLFSTFGGYLQDSTGENTRHFAVAIHDGDIAAGLPDPVIPEPTLEVRGDGKFLYDPINDVTWMADANHPWNNDYDDDSAGPGSVQPNGVMTFAAAQIWADQLIVDGVDDWRLPLVTEFDLSCFTDPANSTRLESCTEGDFTDLWLDILELERAERPFETENLADIRLFDHWQADQYWTGSLNANDPSGTSAHGFSTFGGYIQDSLSARLNVIAVRDGDIADLLSPVPSPASAWLFATALLGLLGWRRNQSSKSVASLS